MSKILATLFAVLALLYFVFGSAIVVLNGAKLIAVVILAVAIGGALWSKK